MAPLDTCFRRGLREVTTGAAGVQLEQEGLRVTVITEPIDGSELAGKAFVTLRPVPVYVRDAKWEAVFGLSLRLQGGVELDVDDAALARLLEELEGSPLRLAQTVPVTPRDLYYPPVPLWIRVMDLMNACEPCAPGAGHRCTGTRVQCEHPRTVFSCPACLFQWWVARARLMGVEVSTYEQTQSQE